MEKIYISDTGPKVSPAVYGFYRWNDVKDPYEVMKQIVPLCLELGINTFDHGDTYGQYQCEELFGKLLKENNIRRENIVLFSKCGLRLPGPQHPEVRVKHFDTSAAHIMKSVDSSLRKLQTDYLDVYLLDHLDPISGIEETALALTKIKDAGKIRHIGVANFSVFQHQLLASCLRYPIVTHHLELNLLNTAALNNGQLDYIKQRYSRPLASAPLAEGVIAEGTDYLSRSLRKKLSELSEKYKVNIESIAVAWLVKLGAIPLIGTTNQSRIRHIVDSFAIKLDHQDWYELYNASQQKAFG